VEAALMYADDTDWPRTVITVLAGVERLQAIVTDLLALARLDADTPLQPRCDRPRPAGRTRTGPPRTFKIKVIRDLSEGVFTP
jgi:signal transduction histidine kinase